MVGQPDFLDESVTEPSVANPGFPSLMGVALQRRLREQADPLARAGEETTPLGPLDFDDEL